MPQVERVRRSRGSAVGFRGMGKLAWLVGAIAALFLVTVAPSALAFSSALGGNQLAGIGLLTLASSLIAVLAGSFRRVFPDRWPLS